MMKNLVTVLLMVMGFLVLVAPGCPDAFGGVRSSQLSGVSASIAAENHQHSSHATKDCDSCGDSHQVGHQCHLGHCGFLVSPIKISSFEFRNQFGRPSEQLTLHTFISSLFRPPIVA